MGHCLDGELLSTTLRTPGTASLVRETGRIGKTLLGVGGGFMTSVAESVPFVDQTGCDRHS